MSAPLRWLCAFALLGCALFLSGCSSYGVSDSWIASLRRDVKPGMSHSQVSAVLGSPFSSYKTPAPQGDLQTWVYLRPQIGTFRLVFSPEGKFVTWYTWFDDVDRIAPSTRSPYDDVADQLRGLRMDNAVYRAGQPW